jgi:thiol-disulfide isomerase/thioredoxin
MKKETKIIVLVLAALLVLAGLSFVIMKSIDITKNTPTPSAPPTPADSAIGAFSTVDMEGNQVDASVFASSKLTLVNVWATFCPPCIEEIPDLAKLDQEIEGFQVLGILSDAGTADASDPNNLELGKKILSDSGAVYVSILPDGVINENLMSFIYAVPTSFFVDQNGQKIGDDIVGSQSYEGWKGEIEEKLLEIEAG